MSDKMKHTPTPWHIYANDEFLANHTPLNLVSIWAGEMPREHVVVNSCDPDDAKFILRAVNNFDALMSALKPFSNLAIETCSKCGGDGKHGVTSMACHQCGGVGECVTGFPHPDDIRAARLALQSVSGEVKG